ncbi:MAG: HU family DNA-binding protein [Rhodobacter sp.]|nr:HU family DNA-binding protein [Rhodobacter sp.]
MAQTPKPPAAPRKAGVAKAARPSAEPVAAAMPDAAAKPAAKPAAKAAVSRKATAKPVPRADAMASPSPEAQVAAAASALVSAVGETFALRKKDLVDRVVAASGAKKKQVKDIVAHTLQVLGDAMGRGEHLHLPPFREAKKAGGADAPARPDKAAAKAAKPLAEAGKGR